MSDMKCPFCGDEMKLTSLYMDGNHRYSHKYIGGKDRCPFDGETLPLRALQEIHRTRKALDVAIRGLDQMTWGCDSSDAEHLLKEIKDITAETNKKD